jgi:hypothetical protein
MAQSEFPLNPALTAICVGYKNPDVALIADAVMPRVSVPTKTFNYTVYNKGDAYTVPNTRVMRKSEPTQVDFGGTLTAATCVDYGLDDLLPNDEVEIWQSMPKPAGAVSPQAKSASLLTGLILLDREVRVAAKVFNSASYAAGQTQALSGTSQWSDTSNSNPLSALMNALDVPVFRPNAIVLGRAAWTVLRQHPKLAQAVGNSAQTAGVITKQQLADLLEVQQVLIGESFVNTARRGQTPSLSRTWGKHCALLYVSAQMADADQPTFGFTAQWGSRVAGNIPEQKKGLRGGETIRVGESVQEVITDPACGYLFQNCVA